MSHRHKFGLITLLLYGCTPSLEAARSSGNPVLEAVEVGTRDRCERLDRQHQAWGALAKATGVAAGAQGLATVPVQSERGRVWLGVGAAVTGSVAAGSAFAAEHAARRWAEECQ